MIGPIAASELGNLSPMPASVARQWHFPSQLAEAIECHHDPDGHPSPMLDAVHVANLTAKLIGVGLGADQLNVKGSKSAPERLGIKPRALEALCARVASELERAEETSGSQDYGD